MHIEVIHNSKSLVAESFRTLRSNLQFSEFGKNIKLIVITSTSPNEGKSEVSINLAASLAQQGKKVIIIDADMRKPTQHKLTELNNTEGLSTFLLKKTGVDSINHLTINDVNLDVLTSGPVPPNPAEMLASVSMEQTLKAFGDFYDYVIIDTPPLLAATDAQILASIADATLLVVDIKKTKRRQVIESRRRLDNVGAKLLGLVMNKINSHKDSYYYYY
ncbi:CpsD/CapB family tyrosine-protein kinase [Streptococcus mitis]|uniref:CpsD/CapB family tyrosine-protein kinase n=1 Tax=Streptococcus mitis TaxID=28037 RepID=UPI00066D9BC6|nr:CpsD/CapB family tyrosine-protein kinase [Streptococcus mitis]